MIASENHFFLTRPAAMKERRGNEEMEGQKPNLHQFSSVITYGFPTYA
jgi:hypothetical protein